MSERIDVDFKEVMLPAEHGNREIRGVRATCSQCGHATESYGRESKSRKRCIVLLREECPEDPTDHYYVDPEAED